MFHVYYSRRRAWDGRCCVAFFLLLVFGADAHIREDEFFHRDCSHWICKRVASLFFFFLATTFFLFVCLRSWWAFYLFFFFTEFCFVISAVHSFFIDGANMRFSPTFEQRREEGWYCLSLSVFFFYVSTSKRPLSDCGIFFSFFSVFFCVFFCSLSLLRNRRQ